MKRLLHSEVRDYFKSHTKGNFIIRGLQGRGISTFVNNLAELGSVSVIGNGISTAELNKCLPPFIMPYSFVFLFDSMGEVQKKTVDTFMSQYNHKRIPVRFIVASSEDFSLKNCIYFRMGR